MPILPIDLQTMFSHMNQIGKEQAAQKEIAPQHQALQGQEIAEKTREKDTTVNESQEVGEGLEKVDENRQQENKGSLKKEKKEKESREKKQPAYYQDPNLGHHIDITG